MHIWTSKICSNGVLLTWKKTTKAAALGVRAPRSTISNLKRFFLTNLKNNASSEKISCEKLVVCLNQKQSPIWVTNFTGVWARQLQIAQHLKLLKQCSQNILCNDSTRSNIWNTNSFVDGHIMRLPQNKLKKLAPKPPLFMASWSLILNRRWNVSKDSIKKTTMIRQTLKTDQVQELSLVLGLFMWRSLT